MNKRWITNPWMRGVAFAILGVLILWSLAWLAVPPIVKSQLQRIGSEKLGRTVTVERVEFTPWTLELSVHGLSIAGAAGTPQLRIGRIHVDAELQSLLRLAPVIDAVDVDAPQVRLTHRADGRWDFDDVLARLAPPPDAPPGKPAKFAIYNIVVSGGTVDFVDERVGRTHEVRELSLQVPFLSNLDSQREVLTEPRLAFVLNGSRLESLAATTPFTASRKTDAQLSFKGLDLAAYLAYLPRDLPVQMRSGLLDAELTVGFEQGSAASLRIGGHVEARTAKFVDARGGDLLSFGSLRVDLDEVQPLERRVHLKAVTLVAPSLAVARDAAGRLNLMATGPAAAPDAKVGLPAAPASGAARPESATPRWDIRIDRVAVERGALNWRDETLQPAATVAATDLTLGVSALTWPMKAAAALEGSVLIDGTRLAVKGTGTDKAAAAQAQFERLPLSLAAPYLARSLEPALAGKLSGTIDIAWKAPELRLIARRLVADELALSQGKTALASIGRFEFVDAAIDLGARTVAIASVAAIEPKLRIERGADQRWMFQQWLKPSPSLPANGGATPETSASIAAAAPTSAASAAAVPAAVAGAAETKPWRLSVAKLRVERASLACADNAGKLPVSFDITQFDLSAENIVPGSATPSPVKLNGRIGAGRRADPGRFDYQGKVVLQPLSSEGRLEVSALPAHAFKAYFQDALNNIDVRRAFVGYRGNVRHGSTGGLVLALDGDASLEDFRARSATLTQARALGESGNELLSWKSLALKGFKLDLKPGAALSLDVSETALTDFFARVIIDEGGRLNLQDLVRPAGERAVAQPPRSASDLAATPTPNASASIEVKPAIAGAPEVAVAAGSAPIEVQTRRESGGKAVTTTAPPAGAAPPDPTADAAQRTAQATPPAAKLAPVIRFGPIALVKGRIDFTDNFVKPNYSADLSDLNGRLSAFSSAPASGRPALADLELRGKAQQTAALEITGKLNPLAKPLELDITAKVNDLDLPPLSPYSVRYAGHGIERGKLSMEVKYTVQPNGQLTATNKLVLRQLRFGDEIKGAPNSLPVRLAVALLADRNGVIDIDFPISGSLNDPQFSLGPLIFKAFVNLIVKAVASPFTLLTGGFGGGGDGNASTIEFAPGSVALSSEARANLDKVAQALRERPALSVTVVGKASLETEREAFQRRRLRELAFAEKRRIATRGGQSAADVTPPDDAQYPELLAAVYKRADLAKPRNGLGLAKDLPVAEMEALLLPGLAPNENTMRDLALQRGAAVRDHLLGLQLDGSRLFLGAVRLGGSGEGWKPGAELDLATQ